MHRYIRLREMFHCLLTTTTTTYFKILCREYEAKCAIGFLSEFTKEKNGLEMICDQYLY